MKCKLEVEISIPEGCSKPEAVEGLVVSGIEYWLDSCGIEYESVTAKETETEDETKY